MLSDQICTIPYLPPDLERLIFEDAAKSDRTTALVLTLVSRRTQQWIEQLVYAKVTLHDQQRLREPTDLFIRTITSRPPEFFATNVKSLCLTFSVRPDDAKIILSVCTGLVDLAYWLFDTSLLLSLLPILHPRTLSTRLSSLFGNPQNSDDARRFLNNITHLELIDQWNDWTSWSGFELLGHLTHIRMDFDDISNTEIVSSVLKALQTILVSCPSLQVCLLFVSAHYSIEKAEDLVRHLNDRRIVILRYHEPISNWEALVLGDRNKCGWLQAEDQIQEC